MNPIFPIPSAEALSHSEALQSFLREKINRAGGFLSFADFMDGLLYAPGLGYYSAGARKFGTAGDFVTAPEMTPLFAEAIANAVLPLCLKSAPIILEVGAGTGQFAADMLFSLEKKEALPDAYLILDISADLRDRQRETLRRVVPHLLHKVRWIDHLPTSFSGVVIGNEVLDAMPVERVCWRKNGIFQQGIRVDDKGKFVFAEIPARGNLLQVAEKMAADAAISPDYVSEIGIIAAAWCGMWGKILKKGAVLLIDYGFPREVFYHPDRLSGTLMCHYRHLAHADPFLFVGLQDVTAHVDFTASAEAAVAAGLDCLAYRTQGEFLINAGILDALAAVAATESPESFAYAKASAAVTKLIMPHEMGELFKVLLLGRDIQSQH